MCLLDVSIVNVALPSIRTGLAAAPSDLQWVTAGYALSFALFLIPAGRLGDARSRRTVFMTGLTVFALASAAAGAATTPEWLIGARLVQGLGGGILTPQVAGFIQSLFRGPERGRAFGAFGATVGLATAAGPLLGGLLIAAFGAQDGWRYVFYVNLPVAVVAFVLSLRLLPRARAEGRRQRMDPLGVVLLAVGLFAVLFPVVEGEQGDLAGRPWWLEAVAAVFLVAFLLWERRLGRRGGDPMIDLALFRLRSFSLGAGLGFVYFAGFTSIFLTLTLYLQSGLHYSALQAGLTVLPFAVGSGSSAFVGGRIVSRYGRAVVVCGLVVIGLGLAAVDLLVTRYGEDPHAGAFLAPVLLVAGLGGGLVISPNQALTLSQVPSAEGGSGAGLVQTLQRVGAAYGLAGISAVYFRELAGNGGDYGGALSISLRLTVVLLGVALVLALADLVAGRATARNRAADEAPTGSRTGADADVAMEETG